MKQLLLITVILCSSLAARADDIGNADTTTGRLDHFLNDNGVASKIPGAAVTDDFTIDSIYVYGDGLSSGYWNVVVFADNSGAPGDSVGSTGAFPMAGASRQWYGSALSGSLTSGNAYYVAVFASYLSNVSNTIVGSGWGMWTNSVFTWPTLPADGSDFSEGTGEDTLKAICGYIVAHTGTPPAGTIDGRRRRIIIIGDLPDEEMDAVFAGGCADSIISRRRCGQ